MAQELKVARSTVVNGGGVSVGGVTETVTADHVLTFSKEIPANSTDEHLVGPDITLAICNAMAIVANKDCVVKTNSSSSPTDTLTLLANKAIHWLTGDPAANKFLTATVTDWYITTGADQTIIKMVFAMDATPNLGG